MIDITDKEYSIDFDEEGNDKLTLISSNTEVSLEYYEGKSEITIFTYIDAYDSFFNNIKVKDWEKVKNFIDSEIKKRGLE